MKYLLSIVASVQLFASAATVASPTISGNTISWPNDGWYQVQSEDGSETLCNGGSSCEVSSGRYLVINHTSGERFNNVEVGDSTSPVGISVTGNTISWPDDGWYQVQADDGSETLCNGGSSCEVSSGRYLVINHTTGERFNNVEVGDSTSTVGISVTGNTISWPDDGWYQVQTADGSQTVCNGGSRCDVAPGVYLVINHTSGERFGDIEVGVTQPQISITTENYQIIIEEMVARLYADFYQPAFGSMQFTNDITLLSESSVGITTERSYSCNGGGAYETVEEIGGAATSFNQTLSDCRAGGVLYNGNFDSGITHGVGSVDGWTDYSAISSDTDQVSITYRRSTTFATVVSGDSLTVTDYELIVDGSREKIENMRSSVVVNADSIPITGVFEVSVLDGFADNRTLTMTTLDNFTDLVLAETNQLPVYTMGRIEIVADGQSRLVIDANNGDPETFTASIESQGSISSFVVPWNIRNILPCKGVNFIDSSACEIER